MASLPISRYLLLLHFFFFCSKSSTADQNLSFSFKNFGKNSSLDSVLDLYGDAKVVNGGSSLQLTGPLVSSVGRAIYRKPIKLYAGIPKKTVSFSTFFSFSVFSDSRNRAGLAFVVSPDGDESKLLSVEFDVNVSHVGIHLSGFTTNLSSINLGLENGDRLQVWIDYEANSKRIEARATKLGENRPVDPWFFKQVDFTTIWPKNEEILVGLASSNGNSSRICNVYSWSFKTRRSPDWMHSEPLDPTALKEREEDEIKIHKKSDCVMRILSALILGIGLGALGSLIGMFLWTIFALKKYDMKHVVLDKGSGNEKK